LNTAPVIGTGRAMPRPGSGRGGAGAGCGQERLAAGIIRARQAQAVLGDDGAEGTSAVTASQDALAPWEKSEIGYG
jgi:hypothetical protein